jgi:hypothetical protein
MSASLSELQQRFATAILAPGDSDWRIAVYRNTIRSNYRNALGATYRVVRALVGDAFFHAAVDAFVEASPSHAADLNVYGAGLPEFLATYPYGRELAYLPDVARLEWALDEAARAAENDSSPRDLLAALAAVPAHVVAAQGFTLGPSCRLLFSPHPVMRIWQAHHDDGVNVDFDAGLDYLLVRRQGDVPIIERLAHADYAFLCALEKGEDLATALGEALAVDDAYAVGTALGALVSNGTLDALR